MLSRLPWIRFYVTTPIYYVNALPHLGTFYTTVVADALARYHRARGDDTFFLTGLDEHGLKIERIAAERGISEQAYGDEIAAKFQETWQPRRDLERRLHPHHRASATSTPSPRCGAAWRPAGDIYRASTRACTASAARTTTPRRGRSSRTARRSARSTARRSRR